MSHELIQRDNDGDRGELQPVESASKKLRDLTVKESTAYIANKGRRIEASRTNTSGSRRRIAGTAAFAASKLHRVSLETQHGKTTLAANYPGLSPEQSNYVLNQVAAPVRSLHGEARKEFGLMEERAKHIEGSVNSEQYKNDRINAVRIAPIVPGQGVRVPLNHFGPGFQGTDAVDFAAETPAHDPERAYREAATKGYEQLSPQVCQQLLVDVYKNPHDAERADMIAFLVEKRLAPGTPLQTNGEFRTRFTRELIKDIHEMRNGTRPNPYIKEVDGESLLGVLPEVGMNPRSDETPEQAYDRWIAERAQEKKRRDVRVYGADGRDVWGRAAGQERGERFEGIVLSYPGVGKVKEIDTRQFTEQRQFRTAITSLFGSQQAHEQPAGLYALDANELRNALAILATSRAAELHVHVRSPDGQSETPCRIYRDETGHLQAVDKQGNFPQFLRGVADPWKTLIEGDIFKYISPHGLKMKLPKARNATQE